MASDRHRLAFEAYGVAAEIVSEDADLFHDLALVLPPGWRRTSATATIRIGLSRDGVLLRDGTEFARVDGDRGAQLALVGSELRDHFALNATSHVFIHAGVVAWNGMAILVPGRSFSGKTTLVSELLNAGASYYSDEYAVVDREGLIHAFAKPLSVRAPGSGHLGVLRPVAETQIGVQPVRAGLIVFTSFEPGGQWRPAVSAPGEAALALMEHTIAVRSKPAETLAAARILAQSALALTGPRGEAAPVARALLEMAEARTALGS